MFERIEVIGSGRVGAAVSARLRERGFSPGSDPGGSPPRGFSPGSDPGRSPPGSDPDVDLVLLCVPDTAISDVARGLTPGPWVAHVSGATSLAALDPHERRFSVHPLQTFTRARGAEQLDGAWAAVTGETDEAIARARWLAETLGLRPFELDDDVRPLYHAGAAMASNYLVTLQRAAAALLDAAGAPPQALEPLMQRTIENGFELTGPIARGDWDTVERHREAIRAARPELEHVYECLADATVAIAL